MGRLLHFLDSFCWNDKKKDRNGMLEDYFKAVEKARTYGDECYVPSAMFDGSVESIFTVMWTNGYTDYDQMKIEFDWIEVDQFQTLQGFYQMMGSNTPKGANVYADLKKEFTGEATTLVGLEHGACPDPLVYSEETLDTFHATHAASFDFKKQKEKFEYFCKHYTPVLKIDIAAIQKLIDTGKAADGIKRIDAPTIGPDGKIQHGEQVHVHFKVGKKEYALNIDGQWKHNPLKKDPDTLPNEIILDLVSWGFKLPKRYY